ncbi:MAG: hypothetical protein J6V01_08650 [Clostridia bacterium]|nr:hypothetical protein [Clostridia bacterium]
MATKNRFRTDNFANGRYPERLLDSVNDGVLALLGCCAWYEAELQRGIAQGQKWIYSNSKDYCPQNGFFDDMVKSGRHGANCAMPAGWAMVDVGAVVPGMRFWGGRDCEIARYDRVAAFLENACEIMHYEAGPAFSELFSAGKIEPGDICLCKLHTFIYLGEDLFFAAGHDGKWHENPDAVTDDPRHAVFDSWVTDFSSSSNYNCRVYHVLRFRDGYVPEFYRRSDGKLVFNPCFRITNQTASRELIKTSDSPARLDGYRVVISETPSLSELRAARTVIAAARLVTGKVLPLATDAEPASECEIVIGKTSRELSDGVVFARSKSTPWSFKILSRGNRVYLSGLGEEPDPQPFTSSYRQLNDGGQGTSYAAYTFIAKFIGVNPVYFDHDAFPEDPDLLLPDNISYVSTKPAFASFLPVESSPEMLWAIPSCTSPEANMMCFIVRTASGGLIVIDGGRPGNGEHIVECLETISAPRKPEVDLWVFNHLHVDHYGALVEIASDPSLSSRVTVKRFCHHLLPDAFYTDVSREKMPRAPETLAYLRTFGERLGGATQTVAAGDSFDVGECRMTVLRVPNEEGDASRMNMNDTSVVYRLDCQNLSVLFLGDSEYVASGELEALDPALLRADIVQVGHHGCGNVSKEIYRRIGAKIGIFQLSNHYWYSDFGEGLGTHNTGVTRTIAYLRTLGMPAERLLTDLDGIVSLPLSIGIDGIVSSLEPKGI